jgi:putative peptide zinc metalloprotease protein
MGGLLAALPLLLLLALPLPAYTRAQGVVWLPDGALVRAQVDGFVVRLLVPDGSVVQRGDLLLQLADPALEAEAQALQARWRGVSAAQHLAVFNQSPQAHALTEQLGQLQAEQQRLQTRQAQLLVRADVAGQVVVPRADDLPGSWVARGSVVAHVLPPGGGLVRVVVGQDDVSRLIATGRADAAPMPPGQPTAVSQPATGVALLQAEVRLASDPALAYRAELLAQRPAATRELPSAVLGDRGQGAFVTDPADPKALRTLEPVFTLDLVLPERTAQAAARQPGLRAWVRFDHGAQPLAWQWLRRLQQVFLGRLSSPRGDQTT